MKKQLYKVQYRVTTEHRGAIYHSIETEITVDTVENIQNKYSVYLLTDILGHVIIDNRKRGK